METLTYTQMSSPIGPLVLIRGPAGLKEIRFARGGQPAPPPEGATYAAVDPAAQQLAEYFEGSRDRFDLELDPAGTPFQQQVWAALRAIPMGETTCYSALAAAIGRPRAVRAVGAANGANPLPIIVPCHRVIGKDGTLTGYAGGLEAKATLLALEGHSAPGYPPVTSA